jgi:Flp pilus assembly protein TadD
MINFRSALLLIFVLALAGCVAEPLPETAGTDVPAPLLHPRVVVRPQEQPQTLPQQELTPSIFLKFMVAEIALQRGQQSVAVQTYLDLAYETKDPRIAQRAAIVAWNAHATSQALEAATLWMQVDPDSAQARQVLATLLIGQSQLADARPLMEKLLAENQTNSGAVFLWLNTLLARYPDKAAALQFVQQLATPYGTVPEAHYAVARAAWNAERSGIALTEVRSALKLRPDWEQAALFQGTDVATLFGRRGAGLFP